MGGLKVSDVYCGNDLADVQTAPILNKLHRLFYIRCYVLYGDLIKLNLDRSTVVFIFLCGGKINLKN